MDERLAAEIELVWEDFHATVNMPSEELSAWLSAAPGTDLTEQGERVVEVLRKRKAELTSDDAATMRKVVEYVQDRLETPPPEGPRADEWRHSLMTVGHDPLKPEKASIL